MGVLLFIGGLRVIIIPKKKNENIISITVGLPKDFVLLIDELIEAGYISSRSEGVRACTNDYVNKFAGFKDFVIDLKRKISNMWNNEDK